MGRGFPIAATLIALLGCNSGEQERERVQYGGESTAASGYGGDLVTGVGGSMGGAGGTSSLTSSGSGGGATSSGSGGSGGSTTPCHDTGIEPNDSESQATYLGTMDDCDANGMSFSGVLDGNDVDWYYYSGTDALDCLVDPGRTLTAEGQVRLCKYIDCEGATFTCPDNTVADTSPMGRAGCCGQSSFEFDIDCDGFYDEALVFLRLDKPPAFACVGYAVEFHY